MSGAVAGTPARRLAGRLVAWSGLVAALVALGYASRFAGGGTPDDLLYRWSTAVGGAVQYAVMLGAAWLIGRGLGRELTGLLRPASWGRAAGLVVLALVAIWAAGWVLNFALEAGKEQGLVPDGWDGSRAAPFVANFLVVALAAPLVEELLFRGVGFGLVSAFLGPVPAVAVTGLAFGLAHGLVVALPVLSLFGVILGWLRWRTGSVYPAMILHGIFNGAALIAAVSL